MKLRTFLLTFIALGLAFNVIAQKKVTLKFQPEVGTKINYTTNMNMEITTMGMVMPMEMGIEMENSVAASTQEETSIESKFTAMKMKMDAMGQKINYDSKSPDTTNAANQQMASTMGQLIGKTMTSIMGPNGKVKKVEGLEKLAAAAGGNMDPTQTAQQAFAFFPDHPVAVGDTWQSQDTSTANNGIKMALANDWTFVSLDNGIATIGVSSKMSPVKGGMVEISKMEGGQTGTMKVEAATGITLNTEMEQNVTMTMNVGGQTMDMALKSKITMTGDKK